MTQSSAILTLSLGLFIIVSWGLLDFFAEKMHILVMMTR